jgi:hypothetical protein
LEALRRAQAPEKVGVRFIEQLGFKSTNDRLFIPLLKAMKFLDDAGKPTGRYHSFLDDTEWKRVLAEGMRDAYSDLFRINKNAQSLPREQLNGKIKSLSEGKLSTAIVGNIVRTFLELVKFADFAASPRSPNVVRPLGRDRSSRHQPGGSYSESTATECRSGNGGRSPTGIPRLSN